MKYDIDIIPLENEIIHSFEYLKSFKSEIIIDIVNKYFNEEEKIELLRNNDFILEIPSSLLELMLDNMNFISVSNMLQNKNLLNKINNLNIKLTPKDIPFIKDYLDSNLILKIDHNMLKNMLINLSKDEILSYLNNNIFLDNLTNQDIIDIAVLKNINLISDINYINKLSKKEITNYINNVWNNNIDLSLIKNNYIQELLFNKNDNFDEIIYLYDLLTTKSILSIHNVKHSLTTFNSVMTSYKLLGLNDSINILNNKYSINDIENAFKYVDINNIKENNNIKNFINKHIINVLNHKYDDLILNFGTILNNYKNEYLNLDIKEIEKDILNNLKIEIPNINSNILKSILNNEEDSDLNNIVNKVNLKYKLMLETKQSIQPLKNDNYEILNNNDQILLTIDSDISENNFIIKVNDIYIKGIKKDNIIFLEDKKIDNIILKNIGNNLLNDEINYIVLSSNKNDNLIIPNSIIPEINNYTNYLITSNIPLTKEKIRLENDIQKTR